MTLLSSTSSPSPRRTRRSARTSPTPIGATSSPQPTTAVAPGFVVRGDQEAPDRVAQRGASDYPLTRIEFGRATEALFAYAAARRGLLVSRPTDNIPSYDMVVDNGSRLFKVQVKGVNPACGQNAGLHFHRYSVTLWSNFRKRPPQFDVCAIYLSGDDRWIFLDSTYRSHHGTSLSIHSPHAQVGWEIFQSQG